MADQMVDDVTIKSNGRSKLPAPRPIDLSENARTVLTKRYLRRGSDGKPMETIEEMFWRVAWHVAAPEESLGGDRQKVAEEFYDLLTSKRFFPNSPTFTGAGTPLGQLAACFVLEIEDDMGRGSTGIFQTLRNAALIQQTGGGNGFAFSRLRPKGARVASSNGEATGPVGFLRVYDQAFGEVAQGGSRRGANMAVLKVNHPDIREFVTCKIDENQITNFNISVGITDDFMRAVKEDRPFDLVNPQDGKVWDTVSARKLFDLIVRQAHHNGEPGMLFLDAANRDNPVPHLYTLESTNPCVVGETRVATEYGLLTIAELAESGLASFVATDNRAPVTVDSMPGTEQGIALRPASPAWLTKTHAQVFAVTTRAGFSVTATSDHRFLTPRGYVELQFLVPGDKLLFQSGEGVWSKTYDLPNTVHIASRMKTMALGGDRASGALTQRRDFQEKYVSLPTKWSHQLGLVMGWLVGDGWLSGRSGSPLGLVFACAEMMALVHEPFTQWFGAGHVHTRDTGLLQLTYGRVPYEFFKSLGVREVHAHEKRVPATLWTAPREAVVGFLQGLFSADGTVYHKSDNQSCSVRLSSSSRQLLQDVQILLSNFGIIARLYLRRKAGRKLMPDGKGGHKEYGYQAQYELLIDKVNRDRFAELIGFADPDKQSLVDQYRQSRVRGSYCETFVDEIVNIEDAGIADVYDLSQPQTHSFIANGIVVHNCGEQFLGPFESCCLGSVNLAQHVTAEGKVDWEKLRQSVALSTRFLDDVVDANTYVPAIPELRMAAQRVRRIGLGIMGLGDLMFHVGVRYGSKDGQEFASQVMEFTHYHCMQTSIELAKERGSFTAIRGSLFDPADLQWTAPQPLIDHKTNWDRPSVDWQKIIEGIKEHGIRNGAQTTVAPTGTISTVAGCEGYGCEPVFALAYVRHFNDNGTDTKLQYTSPAFEQALIQTGLSEEERGKIIEQVNQTGSCQDVPGLPEQVRHAFVVASDISAEEHVWMQAVMQRFCSNAISKTCNFSPSATEEDVAKAYQLAWELGCKGLTVYVAGSREKVVLETADTAKSKDAPKVEAVPLPLFKDEVKKPRSHVLKGYTYRLETPLGTTFVTVNENGGDQPFEVFLQTAKAGSDTAAVSEAMGRLISYILRMNSPIEPRKRLKEVVRQMEGIGGGRSMGLGPNRVRSLPDGIAQILDDYLRGEGLPASKAAEISPPAPEAVPAGQMSLLSGGGSGGGKEIKGDLCPECGQASVVNEEGCRKCYSCGFSEC